MLAHRAVIPFLNPAKRHRTNPTAKMARPLGMQLRCKCRAGVSCRPGRLLRAQFPMMTSDSPDRLAATVTGMPTCDVAATTGVVPSELTNWPPNLFTRY